MDTTVHGLDRCWVSGDPGGCHSPLAASAPHWAGWRSSSGRDFLEILGAHLHA